MAFQEHLGTIVTLNCQWWVGRGPVKFYYFFYVLLC